MQHRRRIVRKPRRKMTRPIEIKNGRIVTPTDVLEGGRVVARDGRIERVDPTTPATSSVDRTVDADGRVVVPGLVDLHGDDVERHLHPRAEASVDPRLAVAMADRANLASGVTTKFHAIAFEELPEENRSISTASEVAKTIAAADDLLVDNRIHARCELSDESVSIVTELLEALSIDVVSLMHHVPENGQFDDEEDFRARYVSDRDCTVEGVRRLLDDRSAVLPETLRRRTRRLVRTATEADAVVASHDDDSVDSVERMAELGVDIAEYPVTMAAARRASELDLITAMGAPNLIRGGSLWDNLAAGRAIEAGLLDVLCSDYHPPSLLSAAFAETGEPLPDRVARVTHNPARAVGLDDRGRIEEGARADLLVVDPDPIPTVECALVEGTEQLRSDAVETTDVPGQRSPGVQ